ncbi:hypothetical protein F2Q69_00034162 [Brassica cretica]|uniref:Uncharacterized protein n=1 Tax=Brassica cretica TaxID=69181 RepID=A0A8S9SPL0_BRACR|nr:hypothetical protein F2Q69_00034162 [Brassica cretica]
MLPTYSILPTHALHQATANEATRQTTQDDEPQGRAIIQEGEPAGSATPPHLKPRRQIKPAPSPRERSETRPRSSLRDWMEPHAPPQSTRPQLTNPQILTPRATTTENPKQITLDQSRWPHRKRHHEIN